MGIAITLYTLKRDLITLAWYLLLMSAIRNPLDLKSPNDPPTKIMSGTKSTRAGVIQVVPVPLSIL